MRDPSGLPVIALVGPAPDQPCGIADYVRRLEGALSQRCHLIHAAYADALTDPALDGCDGLLVHYERSLVPDPGYLERLARRRPGQVFLVPHEVYAEDPFAFPYAGLRSAFPPLVWLKRLRYRWRHREYARERDLQRRAYHAHRVIPIVREAGDILKSLADGPGPAGRILPPVPHARFDPAVPAADPAAGKALFARRPEAVAGIFGFLNPGLDYGAALDLVAAEGGRLGLLLMGGERAGYPVRGLLERAIEGRGIGDSVRVTGYLAESEVGAWLARCDFFLCPMRFKSSSGSLLQLFSAGRPVLVPENPLTRFLRDEGAPLDLYRSPVELRDLAREVMAGRRGAPPDRYRWDLDHVAVAYLKVILAHSRSAALPG